MNHGTVRIIGTSEGCTSLAPKPAKTASGFPARHVNLKMNGGEKRFEGIGKERVTMARVLHCPGTRCPGKREVAGNPGVATHVVDVVVPAGNDDIRGSGYLGKWNLRWEYHDGKQDNLPSRNRE